MATKDNEFEWLDKSGSSAYSLDEANAVKIALDKKLKRFTLDVQSKARKYKLIGSGKLSSQAGTKITVTQQGSLTIAEIFVIYYGLFQNYGVRGWGDTRNAPNSPYSFKTKGMDEAGRQSIRKMITSGKKKVRNVQYKKVGLETKASEKRNPIDVQTDQAIWNIKKYGIKAKPFFTEAFRKQFGKFDTELFTAIKKQIIAELKKK